MKLGAADGRASRHRSREEPREANRSRPARPFTADMKAENTLPPSLFKQEFLVLDGKIVIGLGERDVMVAQHSNRR